MSAANFVDVKQYFNKLFMSSSSLGDKRSSRDLLEKTPRKAQVLDRLVYLSGGKGH